MMKRKRTVVDERQRMELLEVERKGFWVLFYGLVVVILGQVFFLPLDWKLIVGEGAVLFAGSCVLISGCIRRGLWDYATTPTGRTYRIAAGIAAGLVALCSLVIRLVRKIPINIPFLAILAAASFVITYAILALMGRAVLRRRKALEDAAADPDQGHDRRP